MIRRDESGLRLFACDRCDVTLHLGADGDAFDIGRAVTADGWTFGLQDLCRTCSAEAAAPARRRPKSA